MVKPNGNLWKIVAILTGLFITALTAMNATGIFQGEMKRDVVHNHEAIEEMKPKVDEHESYIVGQKMEQIYLKEKIEKIDRTQDTILGKINELKK